MAQTSVAQFATQLKMQAGALLEQLNRAGVTKSEADDLLSEQDKSRLLEYLRRSHGGEAKTKITLTRRETSEIRSQDSHGKSHTVQVEVRKKRVLVKRDVAEVRAERSPGQPLPAVPEAVVVAAEAVAETRAEAVVETRVEPAVEVKTAPPSEVKAVPLVEAKAVPIVEVKAVEPVVEVGPCRCRSENGAAE
jgi:translation initiation factor IF-2